MKFYEPHSLPAAGTNEEAMFVRGQALSLVTSAVEGQC